jgi:hypothetical protein
MVCTVKAETEMMLFSPDTDNHIEIGEEIDITVAVRPDREIDTVAIDKLTWDKDVLDFINIRQGNLFENSLVWLEGKIGIGNLSGLCWGCNVPTSTDGDFATFTFKGKGNGDSEIKLESVGIARAGDDIPTIKHNLVVFVGSGSDGDSFSPDVNQSGENNGDSEIQIPVFFIMAIIVIVVAVLFLLLKRGKMGR